MNILHVAKTESTNEDAKKISADMLPCILIADEQTGGKGTKGRKFFSPQGGLYMTVAFRPRFDTEEAVLKVTTLAAYSTQRAVLKTTGVQTTIKPINDLQINGKKVCGILAESMFPANSLKADRMIVGFGINITPNDWPDELKDIVTHLENPTKEFTRDELAVSVVNELFDELESLGGVER